MEGEHVFFSQNMDICISQNPSLPHHEDYGYVFVPTEEKQVCGDKSMEDAEYTEIKLREVKPTALAPPLFRVRYSNGREDNMDCEELGDWLNGWMLSIYFREQLFDMLRTTSMQKDSNTKMLMHLLIAPRLKEILKRIYAVEAMWIPWDDVPEEAKDNTNMLLWQFAMCKDDVDTVSWVLQSDWWTVVDIVLGNWDTLMSLVRV